MAGHSKWAQIKRQKGTADVKRGQLFSKIARMIILAARAGDSNPETNQSLKSAVEKAKSVNMPKDNIDRAIAKATSKDASALEEFLYEAYGPEGSAFLIEGITDSKNRSTQELKHLIGEYGGKFASPGTVLWLFDKKSILRIALNECAAPRDDVELAAIDAGAESIDAEDGMLFATVPPASVQKAEAALKDRGIAVAETSTEYIPKTTIPVSAQGKESVATLIEKLENYDDVQHVYTNAEL